MILDPHCSRLCVQGYNDNVGWGLNLEELQKRLSMFIHYNVWDEIIYPFPFGNR